MCKLELREHHCAHLLSRPPIPCDKYFQVINGGPNFVAPAEWATECEDAKSWRERARILVDLARSPIRGVKFCPRCEESMFNENADKSYTVLLFLENLELRLQTWDDRVYDTGKKYHLNVWRPNLDQVMDEDEYKLLEKTLTHEEATHKQEWLELLHGNRELAVNARKTLHTGLSRRGDHPVALSIVEDANCKLHAFMTFYGRPIDQVISYAVHELDNFKDEEEEAVENGFFNDPLGLGE
ncbi:hypothetical protein M501DRAFT_985372 [Patellaria atrata CBS 101060]|uniref:Uncharacterized protein n=1 Tax=Patellaria atrata CBS 101060 TaxID=1346257 RepID=A0A9P4SIE1_9PEZI|nr:hypothetical protein M501DRAFT_985372 [Patellaria atrata CBS 101060]